VLFRSVALTCAVWLLFSTVACLAALTSGQHAAAHRFAGCAPPAARRILQTAIIGTWVLVPGAAYAVTPTTPAPLVVHVDRHGRIAPADGTDLERIPRSDETPVVRAPSTPRATTTSAAPRATTVDPAPTRPAPTLVPQSNPRRDSRVTQPAFVAPISARSTVKYVVHAGDSLWGIARAEVTRSGGGQVDDAAIARYWLRVVAANRATLRSGNPSLIFPGEIVTLP
jgi:nucleoid-associated protein YgaU